ncbi:Excinuclease ABC subunit B [Bernardetia litoralis DSM 6794]|uniref:UvrABC system protein B n=1 Tax=Bernardetia litoralis (strain ATCC 23117 / DSM 6794 / NBRC 15988 / NCIMB 1366 / Fx l1 / Sio-4) TaxID=880071 RepID=I4AMG2_BERLS|nr:excinuclease ABC subunit UvrB [Bernardetia litoralis]AFM05147.1 Excinuclease ABC subunit B [Bernardetia litoralis DSM 6794]
MNFRIDSPYKPTGDQPKAIKALVKGIEEGEDFQVLLGVTGSGKTFTMANVIEKLNRPTLIISHNKTLAAQLYGEFKQFFPDNAVEYFISYYDYYQPEAYISTSDTYIEKDLAINQDIEKLRLSTTASLLSGRKDVIVIASVSCIYGLGNPNEFAENSVKISTGDQISLNAFLLDLVAVMYSRSEEEFVRGTFRVKGDTVDIYPAYADIAYRIYFWGDEIEAIQRIDPLSGKKINDEEYMLLFAASLFVTSKDTITRAMEEIEIDLEDRVRFYENEGRFEEAARVKERTESDLEMMKELGYCSGIENYSRYFDNRKAGERSFCLLDYFPKDFLMIIDESHVTVPQIRAMWGGDRSRKISLVDHGFRLPAALDNRPLTFNEFESMIDQAVFVTATPADYELQKSEGVIVEQIIRPTGLLDPLIEVRPTRTQIDDLLNEIDKTIANGERALVTTITKRMAEELSRYFEQLQMKVRYIHSDVKILDRIEIIRELRLGVIDVLIGVNMLREGLDLPEVSLVAILDADKEGFLRNERSLIQTIGRAARNSNGHVVMYADKITPSMRLSIDETNRRRKIQQEYNEANGITPTTVFKSKEAIMKQTSVADSKSLPKEFYEESKMTISIDPVIKAMNVKELSKVIDQTKRKMEKAAKELNFMEAARLRDEWQELQNLREEKVEAE